MQRKSKSITGKSTFVPLSLDDTVLDLKMKLFAWDKNFYPFESVLIHDGQELANELTLRHYNITSNSIVLHILRRKYQARGGCGSRLASGCQGEGARGLSAREPCALGGKNCEGRAERKMDVGKCFP
uniref:Ubiquitin-like domain-containing protein n=1 Tax=Phasianus colchicus TaxID=9054 RepID=A0A669PJ21_PHACC